MGPTFTAGARAVGPLAEWPAIDAWCRGTPYGLCHLGPRAPGQSTVGITAFGGAILATAAAEFGLTFLRPPKQQR